jgi:hypothetical protein
VSPRARQGKARQGKARAEPQINDGWGTVSLQTPMFLPMERKKDGSRLIQPKGRPISASRIYGISQPNELPSTLTCKKFGSLLANRITFMERDTLGHRTKEAAFTFESENFPSGAVDLETHKGNSRFNVVYQEGTIRYSSRWDHTVCKSNISITTNERGIEQLVGEIECKNLVGNSTALDASQGALDDLDIRVNFRCDVDDRRM